MVIFQELISDLLAAGWTQKEVADAVECSQSNIARLLKDANAEPRYAVGANLVDLHEAEVG